MGNFLQQIKINNRISKMTNTASRVEGYLQEMSGKYGETKELENKVTITIEKIKNIEFREEQQEIDSFKEITKEEKEDYKKVLVSTKQIAVDELQPSIRIMQELQANMLITIHKANFQITVLKVKSSLLGNAILQTKTLEEMERAGYNIEAELRETLNKLKQYNSLTNKKLSLCSSIIDTTSTNVPEMLTTMRNKFADLKV